MDANEVGVWVAIAALAFTVLSSAVAVSFFLGRVFERLSAHHERLMSLEEGEAANGGKTSTLRDEVTRLATNMEHFGAELKELKDDVRRRFEDLGRAVQHAEAVARNAALGEANKFREVGL